MAHVLLMEYPFNLFFVNLVCYIRDTLFKYFENVEEERGGENSVDEKQLYLIKENYVDFKSQMEPLISILQDMCNTQNEVFNQFIHNIILR